MSIFSRWYGSVPSLAIDVVTNAMRGIEALNLIAAYGYLAQQAGDRGCMRAHLSHLAAGTGWQRSQFCDAVHELVKLGLIVVDTSRRPAVIHTLRCGSPRVTRDRQAGRLPSHVIRSADSMWTWGLYIWYASHPDGFRGSNASVASDLGLPPHASVKLFRCWRQSPTTTVSPPYASPAPVRRSTSAPPQNRLRAISHSPNGTVTTALSPTTRRPPSSSAPFASRGSASTRSLRPTSCTTSPRDGQTYCSTPSGGRRNVARRPGDTCLPWLPHSPPNRMSTRGGANTGRSPVVPTRCHRPPLNRRPIAARSPPHRNSNTRPPLLRIKRSLKTRERESVCRFRHGQCAAHGIRRRWHRAPPAGPHRPRLDVQSAWPKQGSGRHRVHRPALRR